MKAVKRFKQMIFKKRPELMESIFGSSSRIVQPPLAMRQHSKVLVRSKSDDADDRRPVEGALTSEGIHRNIDISDDLARLPRSVDEVAIIGGQAQKPQEGLPTDQPKTQDEHRLNSPLKHAGTFPQPSHVRKGQAHDLSEDYFYLYIGTGLEDGQWQDGEPPIVSESPGAVEIDVYELAYQEEIERIVKERKEKGRAPTLFLTRRIEDVKTLRENVVQSLKECEHIEQMRSHGETAKGGLQSLLTKAKENAKEAKDYHDGKKAEHKMEFKTLIAKAKENAREAVEEHDRRKAEKKASQETDSSGT